MRASVAFIVMLAGCSRMATRENPYLDMLPDGAQEVRSQTIPAGIDYSFFLKAKVSPTEFAKFVEAACLGEGGAQDVNLQEDEVKAWWYPKRSGVYYGLLKRREDSDAIGAILWATYEDGYLYFKYTDL